MPEEDEKMIEVISEAWKRRHGGGMVVGFFVVAEGVKPDGERRLEYFWSRDTRTWQVKGWMKEAIDDQLIGEMRDMIEGEDDA